MVGHLPVPVSSPQPVSDRTRRRRWRDKFRDAFRGVKLGIRGNSSFAVHFFVAAAALATCVALDCRLIEWCLILFCIGGVFTAELFNSAIETLFHGLDAETRSRWNGCLDIAAGAVLIASIFAMLVGLMVFGNRIAELLGWWN